MAVAAGSLALPTLLKLATVMAGQNQDFLTCNQLPVVSASLPPWTPILRASNCHELWGHYMGSQASTGYSWKMTQQCRDPSLSLSEST